MREIRYYVMYDAEDFGDGAIGIESLREAIESMKNNENVSAETYICVVDESHNCEDDTNEIDEISFEKAMSMTSEQIAEAEARYNEDEE